MYPGNYRPPPHPIQHPNPYGQVPAPPPGYPQQPPPLYPPPPFHNGMVAYQQPYPAGPSPSPAPMYPAPSPNPNPMMTFQQSDCQGNKRMLLIGINYRGQSGELRGCVNDVQNIRRFLSTRYGFREELLLTDDNPNPAFQPTRENILNAMAWLVGGARPGDSLFFHYSGHGGLVRDRDGDEKGGMDSCIYPLDHRRSGPILDDEIHARMVKYLPPGVRLTAIFDCCHSGTGMDLPYEYAPDGTLKKYDPLKESLSNVGKSLRTGRGLVGSLLGSVDTLLSGGNASRAQELTRQTRTSSADVIMLSGCKDTQTSADTFVGGVGATGAMSYAFIRALTENPQQTYLSLLQHVRDVLRREYSQKPQLSSGYPMNMHQPFIM